VSVDHRPDLSSSLHEITEYLDQQQAYDLFDYLLRDLLTAQPKDPLQHLVNCLDVQVPSGPLQVFVCSSPGTGRSRLCKDLALKLGLTYISAGELLRDKLGVDVSKADLADDKDTSEVVLEAIKQAKSLMQGFVLDGFPRTSKQTSMLKENAIVPTHVLVLKANGEKIMERQGQINAGVLEGSYVDPKLMESKLNMYTCHISTALECYASKIKVIDAFAPPEFVSSEVERSVRMLPRSKGPSCPKRVLVIGPRGSGAREHASRLAARLGLVFVDGEQLQTTTSRQLQSTSDARPSSPSCSSGKAGYSTKPAPTNVTTSIDLPKEKLASIAGADPLGAIGVRLRQPDCKSQGYVLCGFVGTADVASLLAQDVTLAPTRVIALQASVTVCLARLRHLAVDKVTGKVWTFRPASESIRKRLQRSDQDMPAAVVASGETYAANLPGILDALGRDGRCMKIQADGDPENVYNDVVEFVERPLPLGSGK
jgi:adenylate kinase family enzyme